MKLISSKIKITLAFDDLLASIYY